MGPWQGGPWYELSKKTKIEQVDPPCHVEAHCVGIIVPLMAT